METMPPEEIFPLEGGWLCLGFCNTVGWHSGAYQRATLYDGAAEDADWQLAAGAHERLESYRALVGWLLRKRQITLGQAKRLLREARRRPDEAEAVRRRAIGLREHLYHVFADLAAGDAPDPRDVAALNDWIGPAFSRRRLERAPDGPSQEQRAGRAADGSGHFRWVPALDDGALDAPLWPVVWSAAELLTSDALGRVRECANDPCGWLFVDLSRNHSRRWCDMRDCGNKVKARRHYARTRRSRTGQHVESPEIA
jgi:predicted RNA-binding Zn ribbon-like protein